MPENWPDNLNQKKKVQEIYGHTHGQTRLTVPRANGTFQDNTTRLLNSLPEITVAQAVKDLLEKQSSSPTVKQIGPFLPVLNRNIIFLFFFFLYPLLCLSISSTQCEYFFVILLLLLSEKKYVHYCIMKCVLTRCFFTHEIFQRYIYIFL